MNLSYTLSLLFYLFIFTKTDVRFTNFKCTEFHPEFATFEICRIKMVRRGIAALNLHVKLYQLPVNNISINLSLHKKMSGYRPFLYNVSADFCEFMANRKRYPFIKIFLDLFLNDSNINHTCPYNHDIIITNLVLNEDQFKLLPLPNGEYMFQLKVGAYNDWKADVKAYMELSSNFW